MWSSEDCSISVVLRRGRFFGASPISKHVKTAVQRCLYSRWHLWSTGSSRNEWVSWRVSTRVNFSFICERCVVHEMIKHDNTQRCYIHRDFPEQEPEESQVTCMLDQGANYEVCRKRFTKWNKKFHEKCIVSQLVKKIPCLSLHKPKVYKSAHKSWQLDPTQSHFNPVHIRDLISQTSFQQVPPNYGPGPRRVPHEQPASLQLYSL
jgi:hypothetical protein